MPIGTEADGPSELTDLADDALDNLIHQFARPLDFLRELVQNSIDAGTPRIEVHIAYETVADDDAEDEGDGSGSGVASIRFEDWGEGMDEAIIDRQLTRMFSSTKEDDLTKIGKFGIGFTSIFAIQPDAVLLRTGHHGEAWELLFHADRSFDKVRLDKPVDGTKITLYKRMRADEIGPFCHEARYVLQYWCEHSNVPVSFWDRTAERPVESELAADPFSAFEEAPHATLHGPVQVDRPLSLDSPLSLERVSDGVTVLVGVSDVPVYGFYNGGLTLITTRDRETLGDWENRLGHLSIKVKYDRLEHTLTRDNVLRDVHFDKAMRVVVEATEALAEALIDRVRACVDNGEDPGPWHGYLAEECRASDLQRRREDFRSELVFADHRGHSCTLADVEKAEEAHGVVLLDPGPGPLADGLSAMRVLLLADAPGTRALLDATWKPPLVPFFKQERTAVSADAIFLLPKVLEPASLGGPTRRMFETAQHLVKAVMGRRLSLQLGRFDDSLAYDLPLAIEGPAEGGVFRRPGTRGWVLRLPTSMRSRCLLVNPAHLSFVAHSAVAAEAPEVAALGLVQAVLLEEGAVDGKVYDRLLVEAGRRLTIATERLA